MSKNDLYLRHHKATYLGRLIADVHFPFGLLTDSVFHAAIEDVLPSDTKGALEDAQKALSDAGLSFPRHLRRRYPLGQVPPIVNRVMPRLRHGLSRVCRVFGKVEDRAPLAATLRHVATLLDLNEAETSIVRLLWISTVDTPLRRLLVGSELESMRQTMSRFVGLLLKLPPERALKTLAVGSRLRKSGVIDADACGLDESDNLPPLSDMMRRIMSNDAESPEGILNLLYRPEPPSSLDAADFAHLSEEASLLNRLLTHAWANDAVATNILFYEPPGLGKTEFARLIASQTQANLVAVPRENEEGGVCSASDRRLAFRMMQRFCSSGKRGLVLVDEAEGLLNEEQALFSMRTEKANDHKAWVTETLTTNRVPTIWIVNHHDAIHDAAKRRFAYSVRFPTLGRDVRERVWQRHLDRKGPHFALPRSEIEALVETYKLSPGHIARAVDSWVGVSMREAPKPSDLRGILNQSFRLCCDEEPNLDKLRALDARYDPRILNLQGDLDTDRLIRAIQSFYQGSGSGQSPAAGIHQVTFLFHGPSGAGKTEFAKYLAKQARRELQAERMSDLLSMWVGGTEQNLAQSFRRAAQQRNILLVDEFDSIAFDRQKATRSWETSQTNELLQQIENFSGVLIACTNLVENLDAAIGRRFAYKIGFAGIKPDRRSEAVRGYFADVLSEWAPSTNYMARLVKLPALYPGDLRAVRQRFVPDVLLGHAPNAGALISAIEQEANFRKSEKRRIGFTLGAGA